VHKKYIFPLPNAVRDKMKRKDGVSNGIIFGVQMNYVSVTNKYKEYERKLIIWESNVLG
jgi:hypothetical protein